MSLLLPQLMIPKYSSTETYRSIALARSSANLASRLIECTGMSLSMSARLFTKAPDLLFSCVLQNHPTLLHQLLQLRRYL
jgi:hypothetical protein